MLLGEFTSVTVIHSLFPDMVPTPYGWGKFRTPNGGFERYFFLSEFLDTDLNAPDPEQFATAIAALHKKGTSPNGMFGFPVTTCHGNLSHPIEWESSWSVFFTKLLKAVLKLDSETNGVWPELEAAAQQLFTGVVPRLLNALQSNGRQIKPSLIHGDLWEGNVGTLMENGEIILYNACSYYAHNEMELGIWRCEWGQFFRNRIYYNRYFSRFPPAEPRDEWEDRNRLYSLKYNLIYTAGHLGSVTRKTYVVPPSQGAPHGELPGS